MFFLSPFVALSAGAYQPKIKSFFRTHTPYTHVVSDRNLKFSDVIHTEWIGYLGGIVMYDNFILCVYLYLTWIMLYARKR